MTLAHTARAHRYDIERLGSDTDIHATRTCICMLESLMVIFLNKISGGFCGVCKVLIEVKYVTWHIFPDPCLTSGCLFRISEMQYVYG